MAILNSISESPTIINLIAEYAKPLEPEMEAIFIAFDMPVTLTKAAAPYSELVTLIDNVLNQHLLKKVQVAFEKSLQRIEEANILAKVVFSSSTTDSLVNLRSPLIDGETALKRLEKFASFRLTASRQMSILLLQTFPPKLANTLISKVKVSMPILKDGLKIWKSYIDTYNDQLANRGLTRSERIEKAEYEALFQKALKIYKTLKIRKKKLDKLPHHVQKVKFRPEVEIKIFYANDCSEEDRKSSLKNIKKEPAASSLFMLQPATPSTVQKIGCSKIICSNISRLFRNCFKCCKQRCIANENSYADSPLRSSLPPAPVRNEVLSVVGSTAEPKIAWATSNA